jgi:hypothetical protein
MYPRALLLIAAVAVSTAAPSLAAVTNYTLATGRSLEEAEVIRREAGGWIHVRHAGGVGRYHLSEFDADGRSSLSGIIARAEVPVQVPTRIQPRGSWQRRFDRLSDFLQTRPGIYYAAGVGLIFAMWLVLRIVLAVRRTTSSPRDDAGSVNASYVQAMHQHAVHRQKDGSPAPIAMRTKDG